MLCSSVQLINVEYAYERSVYVCVCVSTLYNKFIHHVSVHVVKYLYHFRVLVIYVKCSNLRVNVGEIERERERDSDIYKSDINVLSGKLRVDK